MLTCVFSLKTCHQLNCKITSETPLSLRHVSDHTEGWGGVFGFEHPVLIWERESSFLLTGRCLEWFSTTSARLHKVNIIGVTEKECTRSAGETPCIQISDRSGIAHGGGGGKCVKSHRVQFKWMVSKKKRWGEHTNEALICDCHLWFRPGESQPDGTFSLIMHRHFSSYPSQLKNGECAGTVQTFLHKIHKRFHPFPLISLCYSAATWSR